MNAKEKMNVRGNPGYNEKRAKDTINFCHIPEGSLVLDIGEPNELARRIVEKKNIRIVNTMSDLDYSIEPEREGNFCYVTCFEVIEHLLNPRCFFDTLYKMTPKSVVVYLSYPSRPKLMWNNEEHFHEYDRQRFEYLLAKTGFRIVTEKKIYVRQRLTGIRPLIRNFIPQTTVYELEKITSKSNECK